MKILKKGRKSSDYIGSCNCCGCKFKINKFEFQDGVTFDIYGDAYFRCPNCNNPTEVNEAED